MAEQADAAGLKLADLTRVVRVRFPVQPLAHGRPQKRCVVAPGSLSANPHDPVIRSTSVSADRTTVFIDGANFGRSPLVTVNGQPLTHVTVDASATHIVAALPAVPPATYLIEVDARGQPAKSNRVDDPALTLVGVVLGAALWTLLPLGW